MSRLPPDSGAVASAVAITHFQRVRRADERGYWIAAIGASLAAGPAVGVIAGGLGGPALGLLVPRSTDDARSALGTTGSAERYAMPGSRFVEPAVRGDATPPGPAAGPEDGP